jgi:hypothetical protein
MQFSNRAASSQAKPPVDFIPNVYRATGSPSVRQHKQSSCQRRLSTLQVTLAVPGLSTGALHQGEAEQSVVDRPTGILRRSVSKAGILHEWLFKRRDQSRVGHESLFSTRGCCLSPKEQGKTIRGDETSFCVFSFETYVRLAYADLQGGTGFSSGVSLSQMLV